VCRFETAEQKRRKIVKKLPYLFVLFLLLTGVVSLVACEYTSNGDDDDTVSTGDDEDDDDAASSDDDDATDDDSSPPDDDDAASDDDDSTRQPPPEAYEACEEKSVGDECDFQGLEGTVTGTCQDYEGDLVCMPENPPDDDDDTPPPDDDDDSSGPPQEAIDACEGKDVGDDCQFESEQGDTVTGTCKMIEDFLACAPEGPPPE
jgi:hypothetical protein